MTKKKQSEKIKAAKPEAAAKAVPVSKPAQSKPAVVKAKSAPAAAEKAAAPKAAKALKAAKAVAEKKGPFDVFRPGTCKAAIAALLSDGQYHAVADLKKICDGMKIGRGQIRWALSELTDRSGIAVEYRDDKNEVRARAKG
jgi:hypothetical protein